MRDAPGSRGNKNTFKELYYSKGKMNKSGYGKKNRSGVRRFFVILALPFMFIIAAYVAYMLFFLPDPVIEGVEAFRLLPADKTIKLTGKDLKSIDVSISQNGNSTNLLRDIPEYLERTYSVTVRPKEIGLKDGTARVTVTARSGIFKEVTTTVEALIDTVPPTLEIVRAPYQMYSGTGGFAVLGAQQADAVFIKLVEGKESGKELVFNAFKASPGGDAAFLSEEQFRDRERLDTLYYAFFPAPFDIGENGVFYAVSRDKAGNQAVKALPTKVKMKRFKTSTISISDSFINTVVLPLLNEMSTNDPAASFKKVNEDLRAENLAKIIEISGNTAPEILWDGRFIQSRNTQVMAKYGDKRTYLYNGKPISKSAHLGYDLASTAQSTVEAANAGVIIFAEEIGIYGKTVIIDHGLGLMSLYGHLSSLLTEQGEAVEKGDPIAKTGASGLAGGDHLHFGILIHGFEVSPLHWWDPKWVKVNVLEHLE